MSGVTGFLKHVGFVLKQPRVVPRIYGGFFRALVLRQPVLRSVELAVTYQCQCRCAMCYAAKLSDPGKKPMSVEQIARLWEECHGLGAIHVNVTGGEPLLRKDLCEVIGALKPASTIVSMVTNGVLLTPERVDQLKAAGLRYLQVSVDSLDPDEHDRLRGVPGTFQHLVDGAEYARKAGLTVCFSTVISHDALMHPEKIQAIIDFSAARGAFLLFNLASTSGGWTGHKEVLLTEEDLRMVREFRKNPTVRQDLMYNFIGRSGCPAGTEKFYVTAYGDVTPCDMIHVSFGNVLREPVKDIWKRMYSADPYKSRMTQCLRCANQDYVSCTIDPICGIDRLPVPVDEHPVLGAKSGDTAIGQGK